MDNIPNGGLTRFCGLVLIGIGACFGIIDIGIGANLFIAQVHCGVLNLFLLDYWGVHEIGLPLLFPLRAPQNGDLVENP